ncbi:MAG: metallopeptidase TldD-related protein [Clostridiaceae bacterium]|nr:metallopeptidase TldD-related protein [Clostridiaceae bacterium]
MIRELYINKVNEIALNVTQTKVDSIRKKSITKSGCRVYDNGYIGVSGTLGEATEETWKSAIKNLDNKVKYKFEPEKNKKQSRDLRKSKLTTEEFLKKTEELLKVVEIEFSDFSFSNKVKMIETENIIKNDVGLEYINIDKYFEIELVVKEKSSINVFDTCICYSGREFNVDNILNDIRKQLGAYRNKVDLPEVEELPVIMNFSSFNKKIIESLNEISIGKNTSIFSDKMGKEVFSKDFTVYVDRSDDNFMLPFFDAEGTTIAEDKFALIDSGVIKYGYSSKESADEFDVPNTAAALAEYDEVPTIYGSSMYEARFAAKCSTKNLKEIIGDKDAIFAVFMEGGDCTNEGDFASPVQMAYLVRNGKFIGKLPEFSVSGNIYNMFGKDYLGQSIDKPYFGDHAMVINMKINK